METSARHERVERRKHKRFPLQEAAFVCFNSRPAVVGRIADVSLDGLGFNYLSSSGWAKDLLSLDILCIGCDFSSMTIPAKTIWDLETVDATVDDARRCGVQFEHLTENQKNDVKKLIKCCTMGEA